MLSLRGFFGEERMESPYVSYLLLLTLCPEALWLEMTPVICYLSQFLCVRNLRVAQLGLMWGCNHGMSVTRVLLNVPSLMGLVLGWETGIIGTPSISLYLCSRESSRLGAPGGLS